MSKWNKLSTEIRNSTFYQQFRKSLFSFIKSTCSTLFYIHHPVGANQIVVRLRLGFSYLCEHKFRHNYDTLNPLYSCSLDWAWYNFTLSFVLPQLLFACLAVMNDLNLNDPSISHLNETAPTNILLHGDSK